MRRCFCALFVLFLSAATSLTAAVERAKFQAGGQYLIIEVLRDDVLHFEYSAKGAGPAESEPLATSPMVYKHDYTGAKKLTRSGNTLRTSQAEVKVNLQTLCIDVRDLLRYAALTTICPRRLDQDWKALTLARGTMENAYGLGQQLKHSGSSEGDWVAHGTRESGPFGNTFADFSANGGTVGNVQIPLLYAVGSNHLNYALFLDNVYKQTWNFQGDPWRVEMFGDPIRFYLFTGPSLPNLRQAYMELVGTPPVPPRKAFGLWVSEFGYRNWDRIDELAASLRKNAFPIDGFVLDLFWFGGVRKDSPDSRMGALDWDTTAFPDPAGHIAKLASDDLAVAAIEESYISTNTATYAPLAGGNMLASRCDDGKPMLLSDWFGSGGMVDWSNPAAGAWIHDNRRDPDLTRKGITVHWTDLGEPERFDEHACYHGVESDKRQHADIHNLFSLLWNRSIYDGYVRHGAQVNRRAFLLTRSGTAGIERYGSSMWSGDIASNLETLGTHSNAQMHMSLSGIDYYGADTGGFKRHLLPCNAEHKARQYETEMYTQWFASAAWFDVPIRAHTNNTYEGVSYETAPDRVGLLASNRENIRQRYELLPYYYSLAHRAFLYGEPLVPPLVYYYQDDANVRQIGHEKLIGRDLLAALVARHGEYARGVYLPEGKWIDYHTNEWLNGGRWLNDRPTYIDGVLRLPAFARAGAILPVMEVNAQTKDVYGRHRTAEPLGVRVYASHARTEFTVYEDDGATLAWDARQRPTYTVRTTSIEQAQKGDTVTVTIGEAQGNYPGAPAERGTFVRLIVENAEAVRVRLNGEELPRIEAGTFASGTPGWYNAGHNVVLARSAALPVNNRKVYEFTLRSAAQESAVYLACDNAWTSPGEDIYAAGSSEELGAWNPEKALKLEPSVTYEYIWKPCGGPGPGSPTWTRLVTGLHGGSAVEWKCVKRLKSGEWQWQSGMNNRIELPAAGYAGLSRGAF